MAHITFTADSFRQLKLRVAPFGLLNDLPTAPPVRALCPLFSYPMR
jgi:hypothetical protein